MSVTLLRSSNFRNPGGGGTIGLDLRRIMDDHATVRSTHTLQFSVMKRLNKGPVKVIQEFFDDKRAAQSYWAHQAIMLEDQGMIKQDMVITGFHEED